MELGGPSTEGRPREPPAQGQLKDGKGVCCVREEGPEGRAQVVASLNDHS